MVMESCGERELREGVGVNVRGRAAASRQQSARPGSVSEE